MLTIRLSKQAASFLEKCPAKHARQLVRRMDELATSPETVHTEDLKGFAPFRRLKSGEYRAIFYAEGETLNITLIGKRNDDDIYKQLARWRR